MTVLRPTQKLFARLIRFVPKFNKHELEIKTGFRYVSQTANKPPRQTPREKPALKRKGGGGGGYPLLIIPLTCFGLGTWQIQRREWKLNLIKELEEKMAAQPIPLPHNLEELSNMEYTRVKIRGRFDHSRELFIGPRSNLHDADTLGSGKSANMGVNVVTPFKLSDRDETILVNRGHVPFRERPPQLRQVGQVEDEIEITGVIRLTEKKAVFGNNPLKDGYWLSRDVEEMADIAGTSPIFIDADVKSTIPGGPHGGQTRISLRNEHLTYIVTWYTLCALTLYLWYKNYRSPVTHRAVQEYMKHAQQSKRS